MKTRNALILATIVVATTLSLSTSRASAQSGVDDKILAIERILFDLPDSGTEVDITRFEEDWRGGIIADTYRYEHNDGGAMVTFKVHADETFAEVEGQIPELVKKVVEEAAFKGPKVIRRKKINSMKAAIVHGKGTCGGSPCQFSAVLYEARPSTLVFACAFVNNDKGAKRLEEAKAFITSVDLNDAERKIQKKPRRGKKKKRRGRRR